jgi:hypothetical protein
MSKLKPIVEELKLDANRLRRRQKIADLAGIHLNTVVNFINNKQTPGFQTILAIEAAVQTIKNNRIATYGHNDR